VSLHAGRRKHDAAPNEGAGFVLRGPLDTALYRFLYRLLPPLFIRLYRMRITGLEHLPPTGPVVLASNHLANIDPFVLGVSCPRQIHFMAKSELWRPPLLGRLIEVLGSFPVRRGEADREAVRQGIEVLRAGAVLGIFPEGHRQPEGHLGQPLPGVALFSLREDVTTVPVALTGTHRMHKGWRPAFPRLTVTFGPPVDVTDAGTTKSEQHRAVADRTMAGLAALLDLVWMPANQDAPGRKED
jgi:1-acyl-sn-glycerol-3-phosphate acyltransferase